MPSPLTPQIAYVLRSVLQGKQNITLSVTLAAGTTTTILDARISAQSALVLVPLTAHAAATQGTLYVSEQQQGQAILTYPTNSLTDCTFQMAIIG